MKTISSAASSALLAASLSLGAPTMAQQPAKPPRVIDAASLDKAVVVTATVTAIDVKNRIATLKGPEGNEFAVMVDPAVKNFSQVRVGDTVEATYIQAVALDFQKGDGIRVAMTTDASDTAKAGSMPGAAAMTRVTVVTNIWALDPAKGTVIVRGPYGHFTEVKLKDPALLNGVKIGDQMKVTFTQAVATSVVKRS
ncbi:hypothetical protein QTI66_38285 [Variovorax sp. J22R133]|uniref:hypothetical protein n=1 Tax=Variovorax brevis TaxID=3053503 RepID=UPI00257561BF|nr:hypothetical protein [Variovorax sp. J22R133]MDM0117940.1 hypothetical protein [Variovorax sp. J22R133]